MFERTGDSAPNVLVLTVWPRNADLLIYRNTSARHEFILDRAIHFYDAVEMYKHLLLAYDGSEPSEKALDECVRIAKQAGSSVSLLYLLTPHHLMVVGGRAVPGLAQLERQHAEALRDRAREMLKRGQNRLLASGIACEAILEERADPYRHIVDGAQRLKCDLIVMALTDEEAPSR